MALCPSRKLNQPGLPSIASPFLYIENVRFFPQENSSIFRPDGINTVKLHFDQRVGDIEHNDSSVSFRL